MYFLAAFQKAETQFWTRLSKCEGDIYYGYLSHAIGFSFAPIVERRSVFDELSSRGGGDARPSSQSWPNDSTLFGNGN
jgi:hypothetical protein